MKRTLFTLVAVLAFAVCALAQNNVYNGHEYVDLDLPSGTLWATVNIGASNPKKAGDYYSWGETTTKWDFYDWNYLTDHGAKILGSDDYGTDKDPMADYVNKGNSIAGTEFDVAHVKWGGYWRMPTKVQFEELMDISNCTWTWVASKQGSGELSGYKITSKKNGKSIFLPAAYGQMFKAKTETKGIRGEYWTADPEDPKWIFRKKDAGGVSFTKSEYNLTCLPRSFGFPVRPVAPKQLNLYPSGENNGHGYVDLGLPSGTKWATCNVGANSPMEFGDYFAWGETETKTDFRETKWGKLYRSYTKYNTKSNFGPTVDNKTTLEPEDDAAHVNWGGNWRMPTKAEFEELIENCSWKYFPIYNGYLVTGPNRNSIFFPNAGMIKGKYNDKAPGLSSGYWSSSLRENNPSDAGCLHLDFDPLWNKEYSYIGYSNRTDGQTVRPVCSNEEK